METTLILFVSQLTDDALRGRVSELVRRERAMTVLLIAHLAEFDQRSLYLTEGCSSMFVYCTRVLKMAEYAAYNRIKCARAVLQYPGLIPRLVEGALNLTTLRLLAPHLTSTNWELLTGRACHKSRRGVEALIAQIRPLPDVPTQIRARPRPSPKQTVIPVPDSEITLKVESATAGLPVFQSACSGPSSAECETALECGAADDSDGSDICSPSLTRTVTVRCSVPASITPLSPRRYRVQITVGQEMHDRLREAQDLLRHQIPNGDPVAVIDRALTDLLKNLRRRKFAATDRPRRTPPARPTTGSPAHSRSIPADVRRAVWDRDHARCTFRGANGRQCEARGHLEYHHLEPFAFGGATTVENLTLRCRAHHAAGHVRHVRRTGGDLAREPDPLYSDAIRIQPVRRADLESGPASSIVLWRVTECTRNSS